MTSLAGPPATCTGAPSEPTSRWRIPLAVLAVQGTAALTSGRLPRPRIWAAAAIIAFTLPVGVYELISASTVVAPRAGTARFITASGQRALDYLAADPAPGGVITRSYLGLLVPAATGRHTYVGHCLWSQPGCDRRLGIVKALFTGALAAGPARAFVAGSGARFLVADCRPTIDLARRLGGLVRAVRRFGCARVYLLSGSARAAP